MEPLPPVDDRRVSYVTGVVALVAASLVGIILTVVITQWPDLLVAVVPGVLAASAILTGPRGSAGRKLGWIAALVVVAGVAAAAIFNATTDPSTID